MNVYDIALTVALTILAMTLFFVVDYFKDKTKELEDKVIKLRIKNHTTDFTLQRLEDDIYALMDKAHEPSKEKNLCDSCGNKGCILQTGIIRDHCDFYSPKNDEADKKPGVGKWIKITCDEPYGSCYYYACSACHNKVPKSQYGTDYFSPYCPACGAKMEMESEG